MKIFEKHIELHAKALFVREQRNKILGSNIANAATPHYKARDIDFSKTLEKTLESGESTLSGSDVLFRRPQNPSLDGNTVELGVEQMQFAENATRYQATLTLLNNKISTLMSAIKSE